MNNKKRKTLVKTGISKASDETVNDIIKAIVNPIDSDPVRFSDEYTLAYSSVTTVKAKETGVFGKNPNVTVVDGDFLDYDQFYWALFRDPLRAYIIYTRNPGKANNYAKATYVLRPSFTTTVFQVEAYGSTDIEPAVHILDSSSEWSPHGFFLYAGDNGEHKWTWFDANPNHKGVVDISYNGDTMVADTYMLETYFWTNGNEILVDEHILGNGTEETVIITGINTPGYYRFVFRRIEFGAPLTNKIDSIELSATSQCDSFAHHALPQLDGNLNDIQDIRVLGACFLAKNTSSVLDKNGRANAVQLPDTLGWDSPLGGGRPYDTISEFRRNMDFNYEMGMFGYLKVSDNKDFEFIHPLNAITIAGTLTSVTSSRFPVENQNQFIVAALSVPNPDGRAYDITFGFAVEYTTNNMWRESRVTRAPPEKWRIALQKLREAPQFFTNATHLSELKKILGIDLGDILPIAAPLLTAAVIGAIAA